MGGPLGRPDSTPAIQWVPVNLTVSRSPLRLLVFALLAVPAILLAVDMTISNKWIRAPETDEVVVGQTTDESGELVDITKDVLTDTGKAERRRDILFGGALFLGGVAALGWAFRELARPTSFLVADDTGLVVRVDGVRRPPRRFEWDSIAEVRSGLITDDGIDVPVLSIRFFDPAEVPHLPAGATSLPPWLHLHADEWDQPAHQVAALLDLKVPASQRFKEAT